MMSSLLPDPSANANTPHRHAYKTYIYMHPVKSVGKKDEKHEKKMSKRNGEIIKKKERKEKRKNTHTELKYK